MSKDAAYYQAEDIIQKALSSTATEFYLRAMGLSELPVSIEGLVQVRTLILSNNRLTMLPAKPFETLLHLKKLDLRINLLQSLPETIFQHPQLQELNLRRNDLKNLPEIIEENRRLEVLDLTGNQIEALPQTIYHFPQLISLFLSENRLIKLPEAVGKLTSLEILVLSNNGLESLPKSIGNLKSLQSLDVSGNYLKALPDSIGRLSNLESLTLSDNDLNELPKSIGNLRKLPSLDISNNHLKTLPDTIGQFSELTSLNLSNNSLKVLPETIRNLRQLRKLDISNNQLFDIPASIARLKNIDQLSLGGNPLNPELSEAYKEGLSAVKAYLGAKDNAQVNINEAKLILVGEGAVGKTCLADALESMPWREHPTTHGIEIRAIKAKDPESQIDLTLNSWDFGGQRVYRPTHQLFFSSPAVYLVVWKPREGPQQGFVKEWIKLIKHREPEAKILVVATHGGPGARQPDIDRQELWDLFGKETVLDFFFVDSKPDEKGQRQGIEALKDVIARTAAQLPEVGRSVPKLWQDVREILKKHKTAYLPHQHVLDLCVKQGMDADESQLFLTLEHRLGHLIHYEHDPALRDIVILKPNWLATAISLVLDDEKTRQENHGIVSFERLGQLWNDSGRGKEFRYSPDLHPLFLRLMERFDLSYKVALPDEATDAIGFWQQVKGVLNSAIGQNGSSTDLCYTSLVAQLVPDITPQDELEQAWPLILSSGDIQQTQICKIVDEKGNTATAEGLFYQLIVRLHKYSLGRDDYFRSVHWRRGLILDDKYNGRALLRHVDNDVYITVRAPFPEYFLGMITSEVRYLIDDFWEGLNCHVMVPCLEDGCKGLFEVGKLIENKQRGRFEQPCPICNEWQNISDLLHNAPAAGQPISLSDLQIEFATIKDKLDDVHVDTRRVLSRVDKAYDDLIRVFVDEAKEGPRLFSIRPAEFETMDKWKKLATYKLRVQLWCEHSQLPLFILNDGDTRGQYDLEMPREWVLKSAPWLNALNTTLGLVLPSVMSGFKLEFSADKYETFNQQLSLGKEAFAAIAKVGGNLGSWATDADAPDLPSGQHGQMQRAEGAMLREFHSFLKEEDPGFGGLIRVMNKRDEFLWVHESFEGEY